MWAIAHCRPCRRVYAYSAASAVGRKSKVVGRKLVKKMFTAENILHRKVFIHTPYVLTTPPLVPLL